jgi:SagB-type dehydrogenase family enzyme
MIDNKSTDKIIGLSSMCFDLSVYDIFGQLGAGGTLVIIDDQRDSRDIIDVINSKKITVWNSVPAIMGMTLEQLEEDFCNLHLRAVLLSGDWIPINMPEKIFRHFPNARVISLGGATEASIWSIYFDVKEVKKTWKSIPYGIPLKNQSFYVLHKDMSFCPVNVPGELFIGGIGVAKGYMNDEEKTNSSFVFHDELGYIYKTGDYGVLRDEGFIEFLGRKDHQIKIKGYRIELGEIEARLLECSSIQKALVIDKTDQKGNKYLCAYIVYNENVQHVNIREFLASKLPAYMIPSYFIRLDNIPLTANGKVDRKSLPEPSEKDVQQTNYQVQTSDYIEEGVYTIWKDVLKQDEFELDQDFFEIGGDSLQIQRVIGQVEKKFKIRLPMREVFIASTVKKLSEKIRTQLGIQNQVKDFEKVDSEKLYYLSPLANWEYTGGRYSISGVLLDGITADGFIHLLSSLKKGITIPQLQNMLASFHLKDSINTVKKMKDHQVLVEDIISLNKLFKLQDTLYKNKYGEELLVNKEKYYQYKKEVHSRDFAGTSLEEFDITADTHLPAYMTERKTWRSFDRSKIIDFNTFCRFLSVLCQKADNNGVASYYYASAGGLYPIDVYIYVKKNRVESLDEGIYYLNPRKRVLKLIKKNPEIDERCYYFRNKEIFAESAFSVFLVYRPDANMPVYKHMGNMFALIDTGIIVATITLSGEITGLGTCSIGDMDFDEINRQLMLSGSEMVVHAVEVGLRNLEEVNSSNFPDLSMAEPVSYCEMEVSSEQKRLYAIQISNPQSTTYNYPMAFEIKGNFHHQKLKNAIEEVAKRHEALRTAFVVSEKGHILQRIYNNIDVQIEIKDLNTQNANEALQGLIRPFDMEKPPLFRVCVLRESDDMSYLFMDFHHIIGDGSSQAIFINELTSYYNGYQVETEVSKYTNYCRWQKEFLLSDDFIKSQSYWMDKLKGYRRSDGLKTDFPRKPIYDYEGDELCLLIEGSLSNEAKNLAKMYGTSYFNLLLAVYYILLHKHTGENDIIVGFPAAARPNEEFFSCIGMFANTLALRSTINKEQKFNSYLNDVREITIGAIENQFYPFEKLVEMLAEERQPGRNPIFDTVFVLQNTHHQELELNGSEVKQIELKRGIAHFDIVFQAFEDSTGTSLRIEYATSLFFRETIERLGEFYITILKQVVANPEIRIKDIVLVSESEKNMILENFINMDGEDYEF